MKIKPIILRFQNKLMQGKPYNQFTAFKAVFISSLKASLKNPQAIFFSLVFPLIFVFIFGSFGGGNGSRFTVAIQPGTDTTTGLFNSVKTEMSFLRLKYYSDTALMRQDLEKGNLTAILSITKNMNDTVSGEIVQLKATNATEGDVRQIMPLMESVLIKHLPGMQNYKPIIPVIYAVRPYHRIDFVLPGQIGFSLLFSTLFGISFLFYTLREQLVLKRFYATPINRLNILIGIGLSRLIFQLINVVVLIGVGHFWLGFTLAHGFDTFLEIVLLSIFLLFILMGVGLIFSSFAKTDNLIPLMINIFSLPQILLSGTFFPIEVFPTWLQTCCKILPLTHFNTAIRKIAFEGAHLWNCGFELGIMAIWCVVVYFIAGKVFKWE